MTKSRWILLRLRNVAYTRCRENQNTHFMYNKFFPENRACYKVEKYGRGSQATDGSIIWHMCFVCQIIKQECRQTLRICVILNYFAWPQWFLRTCLSVTLHARCLPCFWLLQCSHPWALSDEYHLRILHKWCWCSHFIVSTCSLYLFLDDIPFVSNDVREATVFKLLFMQFFHLSLLSHIHASEGL